MAFATANLQQANFGSFNGLVGDWTGSQGDASGTIQVPGGRVYLVHFYDQDDASQEDRPTPTSVSVSGVLATITVHNHVDVAQGRFLIIYA